MVLALVLPAMLSGCGNTFRAPAAVVYGVDITDRALRASIPEFRFLSTINQRPCGQAGAGESATAACSRFALGQLIVEQLVRPFADGHHIRVRATEAVSSIIPLEQRFGGRSQLVKQLQGRLSYGAR